MSMAVAHPNSPSDLGRAQWLAEEIFSWAGLKLCVSRIAALFLENIVMLHGESIGMRSEFGNSFGHAEVPWISADDAANLVTAAVLHPNLFDDNAIHYPPGAELRSHEEIAAMLSEELGRPIRFSPLSREEWTRQLLSYAAREPASVINPDMAKHMPAVAAALAASKAPIRPPDPNELARLTGHVPGSVRDFLHPNRSSFGAQ